MDLRCIKRFTLPSPYKTFDDGKVYHLDVEGYDLKKYPWLKFFAPPDEKPVGRKGKSSDDILK